MQNFTSRTSFTAAFILLAAIAMAPHALADITAVIGASVDAGSPPANLEIGSVESNTEARVYTEALGVTLGADLDVDHLVSAGTLPDVVNSTNAPVSGTILSGSLVNSYILHTDPVGDAGTVYEGAVEFTHSILGFIFRTSSSGSSFIPSDALFSPGTTFSTSNIRGLEISGNDQFAIDATGHSLRYSFRTSVAVDDIRIITSANPIPAPAALPAGIALLGMLAAKRRRRTA